MPSPSANSISNTPRCVLTTLFQIDWTIDHLYECNCLATRLRSDADMLREAFLDVDEERINRAEERRSKTTHGVHENSINYHSRSESRLIHLASHIGSSKETYHYIERHPKVDQSTPKIYKPSMTVTVS